MEAKTMSLEEMKALLNKSIIEDFFRTEATYYQEDTISDRLCYLIRDIFNYDETRKNLKLGPIKIKNPLSNKTFYPFTDIIKARQIGNLEKKIGDILGIVLYEEKNKEEENKIEKIGLFFWEAKKIFPDNQIKSFRKEQHERLIHNLGVSIEVKNCKAEYTFLKYIFYDLKLKNIGIINPFFIGTSPDVENIRTFLIDFPTYYCYNVLLGNDLLIPKLSVINLHSIKEILEAFISHLNSIGSPPQYLIIQANGIDMFPKLSINIIKELKTDLEKIINNQFKNTQSKNTDIDPEPEDYEGPDLL